MAEPKVRFKRDDGTDYSAWKQGRFGDLIEVYDEKVSSDSMLPVLTSSKTDGIQYQSDHFGREQLHDIAGYNVIPRGYCTYRNRSDGTDFTFNINNVCDKGIVSKFYPVFRANDKCNLYFLMTLMNNEPNTVRKIAATAKGTGQKVLSFTDLQKIEINIPCLEEQRKIADFLTAVDEVIAASEQEVANLETQKKAVMKKIFSQEVRFKREDGTDFPEWEAKDFKEEADYLSGLTYSPDDVVLNPDDGILVLRSSNIQGGIIDYQDNVFVKCKISDNLFVQENDVLMCVRNGSKKLVGKTALIKKSDLGHTWGAFMMIIRSHTDNRFIYHYLNSDNFYKQMFPDVNTATIAQITKGMLNDCVVEMPCLEEQRLIADFLSDFDEAIAAAKKERELWKELKKGLLQQMFV